MIKKLNFIANKLVEGLLLERDLKKKNITLQEYETLTSDDYKNRYAKKKMKDIKKIYKKIKLSSINT